MPVSPQHHHVRQEDSRPWLRAAAAGTMWGGAVVTRARPCVSSAGGHGRAELPAQACHVLVHAPRQQAASAATLWRAGSAWCFTMQHPWGLCMQETMCSPL